MQLIIKDKGLAQLISKTVYADAIYISIIDDEFYRIMPFGYATDTRHDIVNHNIPRELLDKIRILLELGTDKFTAFEPIIPYLEKDK